MPLAGNSNSSKAQELMGLVNAALGKKGGPPIVKMASDPYLKVTRLKTNVLPFDDLLDGGIPRGRMIEVFGDYCLAPQTMILCADLHWRRLDELQVGDELIGFDEQELGRVRTKYRRAVVESLGTAALPTYEIVNDQGETTYASDGHLWLVRTPYKRVWKRTDELQADDRIVWFGSPWEYDESREAGWLAGVYDGEGWLTDTRVGVAQNSGDVLDNVIRLLEERDFTPAMSVNAKDCKTVRLLGGKYEELRLLGSIRPERLLKKADVLWEGKATWSKTSGTTRVVSVKYVGIKGVVTIGTSTKTLIADGMLSHNSTLKSYVGLRAIAQCQSEGGVAALIDTEGAFDPDWAEQLGVNVDDLIIWPERNDDEVHTGEEAMDVAQTLIMGKLDLLVFDSIAATAPKDVMSKRLHGESIQPARLAALMSEALRRLTTVNGKTAIMFINQTRTNIGVTFGSNEALPGGKAMPFYASYRIRLKKTGKITENVKTWDGEKMIDSKKVVGQKFVAMCEKSKLSAPHGERHFVWTVAGDDSGVDEIGYLVAQGLEVGAIEQSGNTWKVGEWKAVGREKFHDLLRSNAKAEADLRRLVADRRHPAKSGPAPAIRKATGGGATKAVPASPTASPGKKRVVRSRKG